MPQIIPPLPANLKVVVVYVYPVFGSHHDFLAKRFVDSYTKNFPETPHELVVVSNGGEPTPTMQATFNLVAHRFIVHDDTGWDIGAYRKAAKEMPCDLMVFFGGSTIIYGPCWLERMVDAFEDHGPAIYGSTGSLGHNIHIRTTGFWMPPGLLNAYPYKTTSDRESRYEFEHGKRNLTLWLMKQNYKAWVVTWDREYEWRSWDGIKNGFHNGNQSSVLIGDRLTEPPYWPART